MNRFFHVLYYSWILFSVSIPGEIPMEIFVGQASVYRELHHSQVFNNSFGYFNYVVWSSFYQVSDSLTRSLHCSSSGA